MDLTAPPLDRPLQALQPDNACFGCGPANPQGLHLESFVDGDGLVARLAVPSHLQGPPGVVNGGALAVPLDCHATWAAMWAFSRRDGEPVQAVTAGYSLRLSRPSPVERELTLRATVGDLDGRKAKITATAFLDGEPTATFHGTFVAVGTWQHWAP